MNALRDWWNGEHVADWHCRQVYDWELVALIVVAFALGYAIGAASEWLRRKVRRL
jgi:hypothetical protein